MCFMVSREEDLCRFIVLRITRDVVLVCSVLSPDAVLSGPVFFRPAAMILYYQYTA
jgi:hypothetical protein